VSPDAIVKTLNREGVPGPFGGTWSPSTIHGNARRGAGILNNELYVGRMVWNRLRYVKNPDTRKRVSRLNPAAEWISKSVPDLRIISDELWDAAKERQKATRRAIGDGGNIGRARRPQYLFSGLTKCGVCGSGFIMARRSRSSLRRFSSRRVGSRRRRPCAPRGCHRAEHSRWRDRTGHRAQGQPGGDARSDRTNEKAVGS
jgi:hypothetical protein